MDKSPDDENKKTIEQARWKGVLDKSFTLLTSQETSLEEFDEDSHGRAIQQLRLSLDAPDESALHRLGYGKLEIVYVPASDIDDKEQYRTEALSVDAYGLDKETVVSSYSITKSIEGDVRLEVLADESDPNFDDEITPLAKDATTMETLELDSTINAARELASFDQDEL